MDAVLIFQYSFFLVLPFWLLMMLLPKWQVTERLIGSAWIVAPAALAYAILVVPQLPELFPVLLNPQPSAIAALLGTPEGAVVAWIHFLAFDLVAGRCIYLDNQEKRLSALIISPILFMTILFGPLGFLLYLGARRLAG